MSIRYLRTYFKEKNLPEVVFEVESENGTPNIISNHVVIEHILKCASADEVNSIANIVRRIDFANGDINHFLKHLAQALAQDM